MGAVKKNWDNSKEEKDLDANNKEGYERYDHDFSLLVERLCYIMEMPRATMEKNGAQKYWD